MNKQEFKILIVDDTPENVDVLRKALEDDYSISMAPDGEIALQISPEVEPDLIMMDVMMPGMDGFETCQKIKEIPSLKEVPVIFVTGKAGVDDIVKGFKSGGVDYVTKPFKYEEVLSRVETHLKLLDSQRTIKSQNIELDKLNKAKNRFLDVATHDLRGTLSPILGYLDLFLSDCIDLSPEDGKVFHAQMKNSGDHMLAMINSLLDVSVIEKGEINLVVQKNSLTPVIKKEIETQRLLAEKKSIQIDDTINESKPILIDGQRIIQLFNTLMSNAIKYSPENSKVLVSLISDDKNLMLTVKDSGPGIIKENLEKIFGGLSDQTNGMNNNGNGSGLSLLIAKKIAEAHRGDLTVVSNPGQGSEFCLSLPLVHTSGEQNG
jgi:two-component system sensor histidine kinase/response regulator